MQFTSLFDRRLPQTFCQSYTLRDPRRECERALPRLGLWQTMSLMAKSGCAASTQIPTARVAEETEKPFPLAAHAGRVGRGRLALVAYSRNQGTRIKAKGHCRRAGY